MVKDIPITDFCSLFGGHPSESETSYCPVIHISTGGFPQKVPWTLTCAVVSKLLKERLSFHFFGTCRDVGKSSLSVQALVSSRHQFEFQGAIILHFSKYEQQENLSAQGSSITCPSQQQFWDCLELELFFHEVFCLQLEMLTQTFSLGHNAMAWLAWCRNSSPPGGC